ncbi:TonB-dependent siderophore receptor [Massilia sp. erpn]|uniref:TonB-dependent siderophore receptor n=1 Tax=Massilia sp. erpn TaxID=2738142 RepID=UPI002104FC4D|nr:TonB-dependent siderophore receptor [Massilia sp. erpn]UTY59431.1 TonB-dependent siderophore receptor [Massilia sp. erpn]
MHIKLSHIPLRRGALALQMALASLALGGAAHAQQAPATPARDGQTLGLVTVTAGATGPSEGSGSYTTSGSTSATGLNLSIRDTPQSVTVITRERLDDQALQTVFDVANSATGVSAKEIDSVRSYFYSRGFQIDKIQLDGIPMPGANEGEAKADTVIYDRVEIVRGATGLMSGTGNPSASINLIRKHADSKVFAGSASLGLGSWDKRNGVVDLSSPLNKEGTIRGRVVISAEDKDNFIRLENTKKTLAYGVIDADLTPDTRLSVGFSEQRDRHRGNQWAGLPIFYSDGSRTDWDRSTTTAANWNFWNTKQRTAFATLEHRLANQWKLQLTANHRSNTGDQRLNWMDGMVDRNTGLGLEPWIIGYGVSDKQSDFGFTASGPFELLGRKHELAVGLLHGTHKTLWLSSDASVLPPIGDFRAWTGAYPEPKWAPYQTGSFTRDTQTSAYVMARLQATDALKFIVGSRFTNWERKGDQALWTANAFKIRHNGKITPYVGALYDLTPHTSLYASYTSIFDPQNYRDKSGAYVDPLKGKALEAGVKGELFDGKLNTSFALFQIKQDNFAIPDGNEVIPNTHEQAYKTTSGTKTKGYEFELSGELAPGWSASLGWSQFDSEDANGKDINTAHPHKMLKAYTKYRLPGAWSKLAIGGGVNWEGRSYAEFIDPRNGKPLQVGQDSYAVASLMAHYQFSPQLSLQVNVNNLFDKKYYANQIDTFKNITFGAPRNVLATLKYKF